MATGILRLVPWPVFIGLVIGLTACASQSSELTEETVGNAVALEAVEEPSPLPTPNGGEISIMFCFDASSSYPAESRDEARNGVATLLDDLTRPGFPGARIHGRWITHQTRSSEAAITTAIIPAVPSDPALEPDPPKPTPPNLEDPELTFNGPEKRNRLAQYEKDLRDWESAVADNEQSFQDALSKQQELLDDTRARLDGVAEKIKSAPPPTAEATDIGGCLQKATDFFRRADGEKYLVIASDMWTYGTQDIGNLFLKDVQVKIIYFFCLKATECDERKGFWTPIFAAAGVPEPEYYDPVEDISDIFDLKARR